MIREFARYWRTIKHLKPEQVWYQLYYRIRNKYQRVTALKQSVIVPERDRKLNFIDSVPSGIQYKESTFTLLNRSKNFEREIDWNFSAFGKLWTYHLNYFEFLLQPELDKKTGLKLIYSFIDKIQLNTTGLEPYPVSLRTVNWIKFCIKHQINDSRIDASLFTQFQKLAHNVEYHLMGNHLLENGLSLLFGAIYFEDLKLFKKAQKILEAELREQVLDDGAHFELSPMYHLILLNRMLDVFNLLKNNPTKHLLAESITNLIRVKSEKMIQWLQAVRFSSGALPAVNDSTNRPPIDVDEVLRYAGDLGLIVQGFDPPSPLGESGYRMIRREKYELFVDVGKPGPDYIPGHAHCDMLSFLLYVQDKPVIVDTGISTYEENSQRFFERSTAAHNTVTVGGAEQSEIWKSFRMGRRAKINVLKDDDRNLIASHNGFKEYGVEHERQYTWDKEGFEILDKIRGKKGLPATALLHLHPDRISDVGKNSVLIDKTIRIEFDSGSELNIKPYNFAIDFNTTTQASCVEVNFTDRLKTTIRI